MPETTPVEDPTPAMEVLPLLQVPPATVLLKADVAPLHILKTPVIAGTELTVKPVVA